MNGTTVQSSVIDKQQEEMQQYILRSCRTLSDEELKELHDDLCILGIENEYSPLSNAVLHEVFFKKVLDSVKDGETRFTGSKHCDTIDAYARIQTKLTNPPAYEVPKCVNDSHIVWVSTCVKELEFCTNMMLCRDIFRESLMKICLNMNTKEAIGVAVEFMTLFLQNSDVPLLVKLEIMHPSLVTCMANICAHALHGKRSATTAWNM